MAEEGRQIVDLEQMLKKNQRKANQSRQQTNKVKVYFEEVELEQQQAPQPTPFDQKSADVVNVLKAEERGRKALKAEQEERSRRAEAESEKKKAKEKNMEKLANAIQNPETLTFGQKNRSGNQIVDCLTFQIQKNPKVFGPADHSAEKRVSKIDETVPLEYSNTSIDSIIKKAMERNSVSPMHANSSARVDLSGVKAKADSSPNPNLDDRATKRLELNNSDAS